MVDVTFVFTQKRNGRRKKTLEEVEDWNYDEDEGQIVVEHEDGPDSTFERVIRLDAAYRGDDPEYAGPDTGSDTTKY